MIDPDAALRLVLQAAVERTPERMSLLDACGLQLAEAVVADRDYPPFARATMDGYAVRVAHAGKTIPVTGEVAAGEETETEVTERACLEIMTGAPCPPGTEAVVQKEHVQRTADRVTLPERIESGQNISPQASECPQGQRALSPGETITPLAVAVMASFGRQSVEVVPRPRLMIITTGSELITPGRPAERSKIRDSNGPMLAAMARGLGIERPHNLHAQDRTEAIEHALSQAADHDVVLLTGGVSAGKFDLVPDALERYGAERVFHKVTQKPGKPLLVARKGPQLVFGLPGNPLSSHFCFHRYVAAAIRQMEAKRPLPALFRGRLARSLAPRPDRTWFVPGHAQQDDRSEAGWQLHPLPTASSADIFTSSQANCYLEVPPGEAELPEGRTLTFTWIGNAGWTD